MPLKFFIFVPNVVETSYSTIRSRSEAMTDINGSRIVIIERKDESQANDNNIDLGNKCFRMNLK